MKGGAQHDMIAGAFAGFIGRMVSAPFDVLKIRFQLQSAMHPKYSSMWQAMSTVAKEEGTKSLWKGNLSAIYLWVTYGMVQFSLYGALSRFFESIVHENIYSRSQISKHSGDLIHAKTHPNKWQPLITFAAGAIAGMSATFTTYPLDLMRTQFAIQGRHKTFPSMQAFMVHTYQRKGLRAFYSGMIPALVGIGPYMGLNFAIYESLQSVIHKIDHPTLNTKSGTKYLNFDHLHCLNIV